MINLNRVTAEHLESGDHDQTKVGIGEMELPNMMLERKRDPELKKLRRTLESPVTGESIQKRYVVVDELLYYLSKEDAEEPRMRLMVLEKFKQAVLEQYHNDCAHWGVEKTYTLIRQNYHWQGLHNQ